MPSWSLTGSRESTGRLRLPISLPGSTITSMTPRTNAPLLIADSSGLISLVSAADDNHECARVAFARLKERPSTVLVPSDVFSETINTLNKIATHHLAVDTAGFLTDTP